MNMAIKLLLKEIGDKAVESARPILARFAAKRVAKLRRKALEKKRKEIKDDHSQSVFQGGA